MATTKITNTSGVTRFFGFIPPHGVTLAPGDDVTIDGDIRSVLASQGGSRIKLKQLNQMETDRLIAILQNPEDDTPAPTFVSVSPVSGATAGGTAVTITGTGFAPDATVEFDGDPATNVVVVSPTQITCVTPAHVVDESVDIVITNGDGSTVTGTAEYEYISAAPVVTLINPDNGLQAGGESVTITGTGFESDATVEFDGTPATNIVVVNSTTITCDTPAHAAGAITVEVTNGGAASDTIGFTYNP